MSNLIQHDFSPHPAHPGHWPNMPEYPSVGRMDPLLDSAMSLAKVGAWSCNLSDNLLSWTSGVYDLFGIPINTVLDRRMTVEMYTDESREKMERLRAHAISHCGSFTFYAQIVRPDRDIRWMRVTGEMRKNVGSSPVLHGLKQDVTEDKLRLDRLRRLAENDALTGLASRAVYESRFLNRRRNTSPVVPLGALILFDLDGFKGINDRLGHLAGDACLKEFAERLVLIFPQAHLTARIGGDEFAVMVSNDESEDTIKARLVHFLSQLRAPFIWRNNILTISATSGIAVPTDPYCYDAEELFVRADAALYASKRAFRRSRASDRR